MIQILGVLFQLLFISPVFAQTQCSRNACSSDCYCDSPSGISHYDFSQAAFVLDSDTNTIVDCSEILPNCEECLPDCLMGDNGYGPAWTPGHSNSDSDFDSAITAPYGATRFMLGYQFPVVAAYGGYETSTACYADWPDKDFCVNAFSTGTAFQVFRELISTQARRAPPSAGGFGDLFFAAAGLAIIAIFSAGCFLGGRL